jgi:hypothetical protein
VPSGAIAPVDPMAAENGYRSDEDERQGAKRVQHWTPPQAPARPDGSPEGCAAWLRSAGAAEHCLGAATSRRQFRERVADSRAWGNVVG